jgi:cephalosporin hydroxylase
MSELAELGEELPDYLSDEVELLPIWIDAERHDTVVHYWRQRIRQHLSEWYCGIRISKFPEDLRVFEQLLFAQRPEAVVELGCQFGASSLWFADRLASIARYGGPSSPLVVAVDLDVEPARLALDRVDPEWQDRIVLIAADVTDPALPHRVEEALEGRRNCFVVEDSAHDFVTTAAALEGFSRFVPAGGYLIVEDGIVDDEELRLQEDWPRGVCQAVDEFLASVAGADFQRRRDLERYRITSHLGGYLQRLG